MFKDLLETEVPNYYLWYISSLLSVNPLLTALLQHGWSFVQLYRCLPVSGIIPVHIYMIRSLFASKTKAIPASYHYVSKELGAIFVLFLDDEHFELLLFPTYSHSIYHSAKLHFLRCIWGLYLVVCLAIREAITNI